MPFTWKIYFLLSRRTKEGESDLALTVKVTLIQNNQYAQVAYVGMAYFAYLHCFLEEDPCFGKISTVPPPPNRGMWMPSGQESNLGHCSDDAG